MGYIPVIRRHSKTDCAEGEITMSYIKIKSKDLQRIIFTKLEDIRTEQEIIQKQMVDGHFAKLNKQREEFNKRFVNKLLRRYLPPIVPTEYDKEQFWNICKFDKSKRTPDVVNVEAWSILVPDYKATKFDCANWKAEDQRVLETLLSMSHAADKVTLTSSDAKYLW